MERKQSTNEQHKLFNPIRNVEKLLEIRPKLRVYDPGNSENNPNTQESNFTYRNKQS